ncbi:asparagine synthetase B family protein [Aquirufa sp. ROCK-SH2]
MNSFLLSFPQLARKRTFDTSLFSFQRGDLFYQGSLRLDNLDELENEFPNESFTSQESLILALFEKYQEKAFEKLLGDFAFVIWDSRNQSLWCVKDPMGIRPLFYYQNENTLILASSISAIRDHVGLSHLTINQHYLATELKNYLVEVGETFFKEIHRLQPAHFGFLKMGEDHLTEHRYWEFQTIDTTAFKTGKEVFEELRRLFHQAVESRLRGVKIAGTQLSGGMDSSAITVLASRIMPKKDLHTFSFVLNEKTRAYSERGIDEQATQNSIIEYAQLHRENHHLADGFYYKDTFECYDKSNEIMGGFADSDSIWQDSMYKQAAEYGVEVMFSGFPGDEGISHPGGQYYFEYFHQVDLKWMLRQSLQHPILFAKQVYRYLRARWNKTILKGYDEVQKRRNLLHPDSPFHAQLKDKSFSFFPSFRQELIRKVFRPHSCLRTESEGLYANQYGINTVYPMADLRFLQFALSLPIEYFQPKEFSRSLFRKICEGILPDDVRLQNKSNGAFTLAFAEYWKKQQLKDFENRPISNALGLFDMQKTFEEGELDQASRKVILNKMDYLIDKNLPGHDK